VVAGTYATAVTTTRSGSAGGRIVFKASGTVNTGSWTVHHDYITIDGFTLTGGSIITSTRSGSDGNYCQMLNNHITNGEMGMTYKSNPTGCLIKGNHLVVTTGPGGDWPQMNIWGTNNIVEDNEIGPAIDIDAFRFWGSGNIIRHNYVHDITLSPGSGAHMDIFQTFGDNGDSCNNNIIENNRFMNSEGQMFNTSSDGVAGIHDLIIRNNVFAHFGQNGNLGFPNMVFYNNTFYDVGCFNGPAASQPTTGTVFKNNVMIGVRGYNPGDYTANLFLPGTFSWTIQYNYFSTLSGAALTNFDNQIGGINGGAICFADSAAHNFSILSASVVKDKGLALTGFNYDLNGVTRPQGSAWDMGAYEYSINKITDFELRIADYSAPLSLPNPIKAELLRRYLQDENDIIVCDVRGCATDKNVPVRPGIYLAGKAAANIVQKIVVIK
jgi:hypothetical protein